MGGVSMEWKEVRLGDILNFRRGHDLPHSAMKPGNIPVAGSNGVIGYHDTATPMKPILTIGRSGNVGKPYFYEEAWAHNTTLYVDDFKGNDPKFLYYLCQTMPFANFGGGSAVPTLNRNHIHPLETKIPVKVEDQCRIASILSSLDRKIELNNKINADLEEMAQAIFKNWFVDFEPFKDGKFVDSELGMIPEGWKVGRLDEIADVVGGSTPSKAKPEYYTQKGIAWLTPKDLSNHPAVYTSRGEIDITEEGYNSTSTKLMPKGTVLFTSRAPIGYISIAQNDICTNQGFKSLVPKKAGTCFLYCFLKYVTPEIENKSTGSTFKEASGSLMKSLQVIIPEQNVFEEFEAIVSPLFTRIESLEKENSRLSLLRDTLLPRLMSGELEIPE